MGHTGINVSQGPFKPRPEESIAASVLRDIGVIVSAGFDKPDLQSLTCGVEVTMALGSSYHTANSVYRHCVSDIRFGRSVDSVCASLIKRNRLVIEKDIVENIDLVVRNDSVRMVCKVDGSFSVHMNMILNALKSKLDALNSKKKGGEYSIKDTMGVFIYSFIDRGRDLTLNWIECSGDKLLAYALWVFQNEYIRTHPSSKGYDTVYVHCAGSQNLLVAGVRKPGGGWALWDVDITRYCIPVMRKVFSSMK